ncbi:DUF4041 domain-containing protein [Nannocystis sp. SCPEA4]|uniref:DUF4041 domain-containing protein n=1 Tax=Nannocystis sp. SCPEA4 TaxID=2996787 RepID=UPI002270EDAA|nr:DUF4041 domain-containing protein [Nannocystis sp. SCPEA4]MCY1059988.1 DUF4041 domain-containing protein [Nannocystis sp. SCPEA4]
MENVLLFLVLAALALAAVFIVRDHRARRKVNDLNATLTSKDRESSALRQEVQRLAPYQTVIDAQAASDAIRAAAEVLRAQVVAQAQAAASSLMAEGQARAERLRADAEVKTARASAEAAKILEDSRRRAEETAAEALQALHDSKRLEQTVRAMKNIIEGYGDQYVMPTVGLLDELAESLSFAEAGERLKAARERVRSMIKQGAAATCDYSEANRRSTAIDFVLDAFNGKVDMILADVRHDNIGTLGQKIPDAFTLVNHNGRAFRNARILPEYLDARLDELKWAVIAQEMKRKEREEQRALKERIREEERAQREYEKALKEAEKEQETLRKAMEKARRELETANRAERAKYEQRFLELTEKLRLAEEKNQRAKSMAQQTRSGHVYVISNIGSFGEDVFKIGMTRRLEPQDRIRELGDASVPFEFDVHAMIPCEDAPALERALHAAFVRKQVNKINPRKEFFRLSLRDIRETLLGMKIAATWTLTAEAREYRETLALEEAMAKKTFDEAAWLKMQVESEAEMADERESVTELAVA